MEDPCNYKGEEGFRWEQPDIGFIQEFSGFVPPELHDKHNSLPFFPQNETIAEMSEFNVLGYSGGAFPIRLVADLKPKTNIVHITFIYNKQSNVDSKLLG